jgi:hypothetical protein
MFPSLTLGDLALASSSFDADTVDGEALLGLVAQTARFIRTGRTSGAVDTGKLTVLPGAASVQKGADLGLLLLAELFKILVDAHLIFFRVLRSPASIISGVRGFHVCVCRKVYVGLRSIWFEKYRGKNLAELFFSKFSHY